MKNNPSLISWHFAPWRTTALTLSTAAILVAIHVGLYRFEHAGPGVTVPRLVYVALRICVLGSLWAALRGGAILDLESRTLTRWWGLFFSLWKKTIALDGIRSVSVGDGSHPGSVQVARKQDYSYHIAIETAGGTMVVKLEKSKENADLYARIISAAAECACYNCGLEKADDPLVEK